MGFSYKTTLTWGKDRMGTGTWLRGQTEHCLLAVRGKPVLLLTNQSTLLIARRERHSAKPAAFFELVSGDLVDSGLVQLSNCGPASAH